MGKIIRTQLIDECINASATLQWLQYSSGKTISEFSASLGLKYGDAYKHLTKKKNYINKPVLKKIKEVYGFDTKQIYTSEGDSLVPFFFDVSELIDSIKNKNFPNKIEHKTTYHIDTRESSAPFSAVIVNENTNLDIYKDFEKVYFVIETLYNNVSRPNGTSLQLILNKKTSSCNFFWKMIENSEGFASKRALASNKLEILDEYNQSNSKSLSRFNMANSAVAVVRYAIIKLKERKDFDIKKKQPLYYVYKDCLRCNLSTILKLRDEQQYTALAHELGISDFKFRKLLFVNEIPTTTFFDDLTRVTGLSEGNVLHDEGKSFVDVFEPERFKESYLNEKISKVDRINSLPINKSEIDSEYCFAMLNNNKEITDFSYSFPIFKTYFIIDSRYSLIPLEKNNISLECFLNIVENKLDFKWTLVKDDVVILSDNKNMKKNVKEIKSNIFKKQYEHIGSVIQCYNYHNNDIRNIESGIRIGN